MRAAGVNAKQMVRAAGVPALLFGVEVVGLSNTALQTTRARVAAAAAPQAGGKNPDLTLYALDGSSGTLDPAFDCHVMPLKHWALAWWEGWVPSRALEDAFRAAKLRLSESDSPWRRVTGPTAALIASMTRLGWRFLSAHNAIDDLGGSWLFQLDSPAAIAQACKRSVRRWRLTRVLRALPGLQPAECDADASSKPETNLLVDFAGPLHGLLHGRTTKVPSVPQWQPNMRSDLASAISGGQWPQTRRASVPRWEISDLRCQLCLDAPGTLQHRHECTCTMPPGGWPPHPPKAALALGQIGQVRADLLRTRGLLVMRFPSPPRSVDGWFSWLVTPPADSNELYTWYLDGSMLDGNWTEFRAVGFGIVVVAPDRSLAAYGMGAPPEWCRTAASAEAWALHIALLESPFPPKLRTDCQCLLSTASEGAAQATAAARPLARIWRLIASSTDGRIEALTQHGNLVWMPAHQPLSAIGSAVLSSGKLLTGVDWRAKRLVDALAKRAATMSQAPRPVRCMLESGQIAVKHAAALLAAVTHAANNHKVPVQHPDGTWGSRTLRDAQQPSGHSRRQRKLPKPPSEPAHPPSTVDVGTRQPLRPAKRPRAVSTVRRRKRRAACTVEGRPIIAPSLRPSHSPRCWAQGSSGSIADRQRSRTADAEQLTDCVALDPHCQAQLDLQELHASGVVVVWPSIGAAQRQLTSGSSEERYRTPRTDAPTRRSNDSFQSTGQSSATHADGEMEMALQDLRFLHRCGIPVVWPTGHGPESAQL